MTSCREGQKIKAERHGGIILRADILKSSDVANK